MEVQLHSSASSTTLLTAGVARGSGHLAFLNELWGTHGLRCAASCADAGDREAFVSASYDKKMGTDQWYNVKLSRTSDGYTCILLDDTLIVDGYTDIGIPELACLQDNVVAIGRRHIFTDRGLDGQIKSLTVYSGAVASSQDDRDAVAYYTFDNGDLSDSSGNDYTATAAGAGNLTYVDEGGRGKVLELNNSGEKKRDTGASGIQIPTAGISNTGNFTLVMDAYVHSLNYRPVWFDISMGKGNTEGYKDHYLVGMLAYSSYGVNSELKSAIKGDGNGYRITGGGVNTKDYAQTFSSFGEWVQLAYVQNGTRACIFVDGDLYAYGDQKTTVGDMLSADGATVTVGMPTFWPDRSLDAMIDNVAVYDYVLTTAQLDELNNSVGAHGLRADCYALVPDGLSYGEYKGTYIDENIAFSDLNSYCADRASSEDYVAVRWSGRLVAPEDGNYTFYSYTDNGFRLYLDGKCIIDWWLNKWDKEQTSAAISLKAGEAHDVVIEWFEYDGGAHATLRWSNDKSIAKQAIPASAFYLPKGFTPPMVDTIDTSNAQLDRGLENFGGTLVLEGQNLKTAEKVELISYSGKSLEPAVYLDINAKDGDSLTVTIPSDQKAGYYKVKMITGDVSTVSDTAFEIIAAEGESDRPEHPRPDWYREQWMSLNGWWDFAYDANEVGLDEKWYEGNKEYDLRINVPFPWESELSGITNTSYRGQVWYQRTLNLDESWIAEGKTTHLYFGAVDAICKVYVNGVEVGGHNGGYTQFEFDITDYVKQGENTITVWVEDKASYGDNSYPALVGNRAVTRPVATPTPAVSGRAYIWRAAATPIWTTLMPTPMLTTAPFCTMSALSATKPRPLL